MKLGTNTISSLKIGSTDISEVRLGSTLVWSAFTYDPDALAYFAVNTAITLDADKLAFDALFKGLKSDGVYSKLKSLHFPIFSSGSNNKWNVINPFDSDAAHRWEFNGGFTHASVGLVPNATNSYVNTHLKDSDLLNVDFHFAIYTPTTGSGLYDLGCQISDTSKRSLIISNNGGNRYYAAYTNSYGSSSTTGNGHIMINYYDGGGVFPNAYHHYRNGVFIDGANVTSLTAGNLDFFICATNENGIVKPGSYGNKTIRVAHFGSKLTASESMALYTRIQTLLTHFGLNV